MVWYLQLMSSLAEIGSAVAALPLAGFFELLRMRAHDAEAWDRQIEEDAKNGRLEAAYIRLMEEKGDQPVRLLGEVLEGSTRC